MKHFSKSYKMNVQVREGKSTECFKVRETKVFLDKLRDVIMTTHGHIIETILLKTRSLNLQDKER
jgi:hypothetical protein